MSNETRHKDYKNHGLDKEATDKRRKDLNIALRKQKREEQVSVFGEEKFRSFLVSSISNDEISPVPMNRRHRHRLA